MMVKRLRRYRVYLGGWIAGLGILGCHLWHGHSAISWPRIKGRRPWVLAAGTKVWRWTAYPTQKTQELATIWIHPGSMPVFAGNQCNSRGGIPVRHQIGATWSPPDKPSGCKAPEPFFGESHENPRAPKAQPLCCIGSQKEVWFTRTGTQVQTTTRPSCTCQKYRQKQRCFWRFFCASDSGGWTFRNLLTPLISIGTMSATLI
jgi:hypothetical protein